MAKRRKETRESRSPGRTGFEDLALEHQAEEEEARALLEKIEAAEGPKLRTHECLTRVAQSIDSCLIVNHDNYLVNSNDWARWIVKLAMAWRDYPGWDLTDPGRIPGESRGYRAARRIWKIAYSGASVEEVARAIDEAKVALKPAPASCDEQQRCNSEIGIWKFFCAVKLDFEAAERGGPVGTDSSSGEKPDLAPPIDEPHGSTAGKAETLREIHAAQRHQGEYCTGEPLIGWAEILKALGQPNDQNTQRRIRRLNRPAMRPAGCTS